MEILWKILKKIIIIILCIIIIPWLYYFFFAYKDLILSSWAKQKLKGEIVYSVLTGSDFNIRIIGFSSGKNQNIYTSIPRGQNGYHYVPSFSFSQNGSKVVFSRMGEKDENYRFKLYTMNSEGTDIKELLDLDVENFNAEYPSFSPDEKKVAFIVQKPYKKGCLYVINNVDKPYSSLRVISDIRPANYNPTWSPDGQKISFISDEYIKTRTSRGWPAERFDGKTYIINNDGTDLRYFNAKEPVIWSPDGNLLLYRGKDGYYISNENQINSIFIIPYKRAPISLLVEDPAMAVWSPDGKYIAYVKEIWPGGAGLGIFVVSIGNPGKEIQVSTEWYGVKGMVWVK